MLRGFFLISLLITLAGVAVLGFRGEKTTNEPWELFPDMVRQMKVRAQSPLKFFADGRGPRMPINGTVPIGYEMPKPEANAATAGFQAMAASVSLQGSKASLPPQNSSASALCLTPPVVRNRRTPCPPRAYSGCRVR